MWYEAHTIVEGAQDEEFQNADEEKVFQWAENKAHELDSKMVTNYQIFKMTHYCDQSLDPDFFESCECAQWITDHHPLYQSEPVDV